jgi:hypothetical protein
LFKAGEYGGRLNVPLGMTAVAQAEVDTLAPLLGLVDPSHPVAARSPPLAAAGRARVALTARCATLLRESGPGGKRPSNRPRDHVMILRVDLMGSHGRWWKDPCLQPPQCGARERGGLTREATTLLNALSDRVV